MWQEVTKHQLQSRHILWELAWSNCFNSYCISWWTRQFGWWRGWRWGKLSQHKAFLPPHDLAARHNWAPCIRLCFRSATRVITPPPHPQPIYVVQPSVLNRSPLSGQPRNMSTSASRQLLDFFFTLNYWFAARNCMTTLQLLQTAKTRFPQVLLREESVFMLKQ